MLADYNDLQVCDLLQYGFPLGCCKPIVLPQGCSSPRVRNHRGAREYPDAIEDYLLAERHNGSVLGPFHRNPFNSDMILSPLNTVPKKDSCERRVILDLSFPKGHSLNDSIEKDFYLNERICLVYPKVDDLVDLVKLKGAGCMLFKKDLRKAYRQIYIDPGEYHKVGYRFKRKLYFDTAVSMGLRSGAQICQRVTNAITYAMFMIGVAILNYLDDLAGAEVEGKADMAYLLLDQFLKRVGISESEEKACSPSTRMIFVGVMFDTVKMTLEISPERLIEISNLVSEWLKKTHATRKECSLYWKIEFCEFMCQAWKDFCAKTSFILAFNLCKARIKVRAS